MRLKQLELLGFKSFASKVKLDFTEGITAIVGPNGSGKSNISDAVRWVLGEQSARTLRSTKMEDVIFAGSDGKKPLGMAEVHLTLDNSDQFLPLEYNEITISRRVYRSGESQFLINKSPCRLKDIHDLFTDTGLGREGHAIISQGQIDTVLSARSQDRRALLEETAGIIKYRTRKEEALRKLERVDHDAERISDILHEIQQRVGPLQKEAAKTRTYNQLAANLLEVELDHYSLRLRDLDGARQEQSAQLRTHRQQHNRLAEQMTAIESRTTEYQERLSQLEATIDQQQEHLMAAQQELQELAGQRDLNRERLTHGQQQLQQLQEELRGSEEEHNEWQQLLAIRTETLQQRAAVCQESLTKLEDLEYTTKSMRRQRDVLEQQLEDAKEAFFEAMRSLAEQRNQVRDYEQRHQSLEAQRVQVQAALDANNQEQQDVTAEVRALKEQHQKLQQVWAQLENRGKEAAAAANAGAQEREQAQKRCQQLEDSVGKLESRRQALEDLEANYEGLQYSVRQLMKAQPEGISMIGTIADVITVPPGWETAIEIALGSAVGHVLVPQRRHAQLAIQWLKDKKAGRATFLPIDSMKEQSFPDSYQRYWAQSGVVGPAMDLIAVDAGCRSAVASVLGRVVLTETLDDALALQKQLPSFGRIVTKEGDVIAPSGAMTGGSMKGRSSGVLNRKNEIAQLQHREEEQRAELTAAKELLGRRRQLEQSSVQAVEDLRDEARAQRSEQERVQMQLDQAEQRLAKLQTAGEHAAKTEQELVEEIQGLSHSQADATTAVAEMHAAEDVQRSSIQKQEVDLKQLSQGLERHQDGLTAAKVEHAEALGLKKQAEEQLQQAKTALEKVSAAAAGYRERCDAIERRHQELQDELQALDASVQQSQVKQKDMEQQLRRLRDERGQLQSTVQSQRTKEKQVQRQLNQAEKAIHGLEIEERSVEMELQQIAEEVAQRDCDPAALLQRDVQRPAGKLSQELERLRREVKGLGMVNPAAIEEYEELVQRQTFLTAQYEDLQDARQTLHDVIQEMDQTSEQRFSETFRRVRREFQAIFAQLFQGGRADLVLTEPEELLETGVEVVAQPPGKKLTNLLLLSGGERSLTAIALLFAIRRVKPTPFCVLDEIDAALDDANLARFSKLMKEFAQDTQFLVITHRVGTMEAADVLYGVTMEKTAASQLMSVKLA